MSELAAPPRPKLRGVIHLIGAIVAIPAVIWLALSAAGGITTLGASVYGVCLVLLLGVSASYHTVQWSPRMYFVLKRIDRSMIFVFIGGSYTPFLLGVGGNAVDIGLTLIWTGSILGVAKTVFWTRPNRWFTAVPYVIIGWMGLPFIPDVYRWGGPAVFSLIAGCGVIYTLGAVVYARRWPDPAPTLFGFHEVFHCLVVLAAACHYVAVWKIVVP